MRAAVLARDHDDDVPAVAPRPVTDVEGAVAAAPASDARVGVIDIGSNSVRLVIFDGVRRSPDYFFNEKVMCGLGSRLDETGQLNPDGRVRALEALRRFRSFCDTLRVPVLYAIATAAVRDASDGPDFVQEVAAATGITVEVASGEDEARLAASGVLLGEPRARGLVADLGGASLELASVKKGEVGGCASIPIGPLRLRGGGANPKSLKRVVDDSLHQCELLGGKHRQLYAVGGSWRALAQIHMSRTSYPLPILQEYSLEREEARMLAKWVLAQDPADLARFSDASPQRLTVTPYGALVLDRLVKRVRPRRVILSAFGLREGMYYRHLQQSRRQEDPLLSVCRDLERTQARWPGYGAELFDWIKPLVEESDGELHRLVEASCLANDIEWRGHPSYRAPVAFETMMRVNVNGVSHQERMFVASVLYFRHATNELAGSNPPGMALLKTRSLVRAEVLGRAMRVAGRISGAAPGTLPCCPLQLTETTVQLDFAPEFAVRASEAVARELSELGTLLGRKAIIAGGPAVVAGE